MYKPAIALLTLLAALSVQSQPLPRVDSDALTARMLERSADLGIEGAAENFVLNDPEPVRVLKVQGEAGTLLLFHVMSTGQEAFALVTGEGESAVMRVWDDGPNEAVFSASGIVIQSRGEAFAANPASNGVVENLACLGRSLGIDFFNASDSGLSTIISRLACSSAITFSLYSTATNCLSIPMPMATVGCIAGMTKIIACGYLKCAGGCSVTSLSVGQTIGGSYELSCTSTHRNAYAKFYTFTLTQRRSVTIDLSATPDTYLYLLRGNDMNGAVITQDDDSGPGLNSRIARTLDAGTYTIEATTYDPRMTGAFTLSVR